MSNNHHYSSENLNPVVQTALQGDKHALAFLVDEIKDFVFNLSLRMLGTVPDAEDACQEILIKVMTNLASFRQQSAFKTWVYRLASNYLIDYKKSLFAQYPLDFDYYEKDIHATLEDENLFQEEEAQLAQELKFSCTNVMLQCLTPQDRCIFILGTMFNMNSSYASELLGISSVNYRKRLSRSRKKMQTFLTKNCGLSGQGVCSCEKRVAYACSQGRIDASNLAFSKLQPLAHSLLHTYVLQMEQLDEQIDVFESLPLYRATITPKQFLQELTTATSFQTIQNFTLEDTND